METQLDTQSAVEHDVPCRDVGDSLTEVLVAVVLMSLAIIPLLLVSIMTIKTSSQVRTAAKVETILAERCRPGEPCRREPRLRRLRAGAALAEGWHRARSWCSTSTTNPW